MKVLGKIRLYKKQYRPMVQPPCLQGFNDNPYPFDEFWYDEDEKEYLQETFEKQLRDPMSRLIWDERYVEVKDMYRFTSIAGHWIETEDTMGDTCYKCSHCGMEWYTLDGKPEDNDMNYCAACGCKMIEVE